MSFFKVIKLYENNEDSQLYSIEIRMHIYLSQLFFRTWILTIPLEPWIYVIGKSITSARDITFSELKWEPYFFYFGRFELLMRFLSPFKIALNFAYIWVMGDTYLLRYFCAIAFYLNALSIFAAQNAIGPHIHQEEVHQDKANY